MTRFGYAFIAASIAFFGACKPRLGALRLDVSVDPTLVASCLGVEVLANGEILSTEYLARPTGKNNFVVGVGRSNLPQDIRLQLRAFSGEGCADRNFPNGVYSIDGRFPDTGTNTLTITLAAPTAAEDADGDGYRRPGAGGADCNDTSAAIHPQAQESCDSTSDDLNCDGKIGCDDATCSANAACARVPTLLALASVSPEPHVYDCVPLELQLSDAAGAIGFRRPMRVSASVSPDQAALLATDSQCTQALSPSEEFTFLSGETSKRLYFRAIVAGRYVVSTGVANLTAQTELEVTSRDRPSLLLRSLPSEIVAGNCQAAEVVLVDELNQPVKTHAPATLNVLLSRRDRTEVYAGENCQVAVGPEGLSLPRDVSTVKISLRSHAAGPLTLTVSNSNFTPATGTVRIKPGRPTSLAFTNSAFGFQAGQNQCVGPLEVAVIDAYGNVVPQSAGELFSATIQSTDDGLRVLKSCSGPEVGKTDKLPLTNNMIALYVASGVPGRYTLSAKAETGLLTPASLEVTVTSGAAAEIAVTQPSSMTSIAGQCTLARVSLRDKEHIPTSLPTPLTLSLKTDTDNKVRFYASMADCNDRRDTTTAVIAAGSPSIDLWVRSVVASATPYRLEIRADNPPATFVSALATLSWTITPDVPYGIVVQNIPSSIVAGSCVQGALTLVDAYRNATTAADALLVTLTAETTRGRDADELDFHSDSGCSSPLPNNELTLAANTSTRSFFLTFGSSTFQNPYTLKANSVRGSDQLSFSLLADAPTRVAITGPMTAAAGTCSAIDLAVYDRFDNKIPARSMPPLQFTIANKTDQQAILFPTAANCAAGQLGVASMELAAAAGARTTTVYVSSKTAMPFLVEATVAQLMASYTVTVQPLAPSKLALSIANPLVVGACSGPYTLLVSDAFNNRSNVAATTPVSFSAPASLEVFDSATCTASDVKFNAGMATTTFWLRAKSIVSQATLTASAPGLTSASANVTAIAGAPDRFATQSLPSFLTAGKCHPVQLKLLDAQGNNAVAAAPLVLSFPTPPSGATFSTAADCSNAVATVTWPPSTSIVTFYVRNTVASPTSQFVVKLDAVGGGQSYGSQALSIPTLPGAVHHVAVSSSPFAFPGRECSPVLTVELRDEFENKRDAPTTLTVQVSKGGGSADVALATNCSGSTPTVNSLPATISISANASSVGIALYSGTPNTTAQLLLTISAPGTEARTVPLSVTASTPKQISVTTPYGPTDIVEAGTCVPLTVTLLDSADAVTVAKDKVQIGSFGSDAFDMMDKDCSPPIESTEIQPGASSTTIGIRPLSTNVDVNTNTTIVASHAIVYNSNLGSSSATLRIAPMVRRGWCTIVKDQTTVSCPVTPDLIRRSPDGSFDISKTFLLFQATGGGFYPDTSQVTCRLVSSAVNVSVVCERRWVGTSSPTAGPPADQSSATIHWQTVTYPGSSGTQVFPLRPSVTSAQASVTTLLPAAVDPSASFVLLSHATGDGAADNNNYAHAFLNADGKSVTLSGEALTSSGRYDLQVVSIPRIQTERGTMANQTTPILKATRVTAPTSRSFLLNTTTIAGADEYMCQRRFRGAFASDSEMEFSRQPSPTSSCPAGSPVNSLRWESVALPPPNVRPADIGKIHLMPLIRSSGVASATVALADGATDSGLVPVPGTERYDFTRTVTMMAGQGPGGQCGGETSQSSGNGYALLGSSCATAELQLPTAANQPLQVKLKRGAGEGESKFTVFVMQFVP